jgi:hypothetical protein
MMMPMSRVLGAIAVLLMAGCGPAPAQQGAGSSTTGFPATTSTVTVATLPLVTATTDPAPSPLADAIVPLNNARYRPPSDPGAAPSALTIEALGVEAAPIVAVGVLADGSMEIPGASEVGWYRFGARPGDPGAAVLAAHIAFNGSPGVFRHLEELVEGDRLSVTFADGEVRRFEVTEVARYPKEDLPRRRIFAGGGGGELTLISCGGAFDSASRSYSDNVVVYAVPASTSSE